MQIVLEVHFVKLWRKSHITIVCSFIQLKKQPSVTPWWVWFFSLETRIQLRSRETIQLHTMYEWLDKKPFPSVSVAIAAPLKARRVSLWRFLQMYSPRVPNWHVVARKIPVWRYSEPKAIRACFWHFPRLGQVTSLPQPYKLDWFLYIQLVSLEKWNNH